MNQEQIEKLARKYQLDHDDYHDSDGVDVSDVFKAGAAAVKEYYEKEALALIAKLERYEGALKLPIEMCPVCNHEDQGIRCTDPWHVRFKEALKESET